jgi:mannose-6-phosphate isomerase
MTSLASLRSRLIDWLMMQGYPLWSIRGIDGRNGGFVEALSAKGAPLSSPRRLRVQPRQIYSFAQATALGWRGDSVGIIRDGLQYLDDHYRRSDGLYRRLIDAEGFVLDNDALLYDNAFVLLGLASAAGELDSVGQLERRAIELRDLIAQRWHLEGGGFLSGNTTPNLLESNPHMHLLEACLAWAEIGNDAGWRGWSEEIAGLATTRLVSAGGAIGENFDRSWNPAPAPAGRLIEPGHQFEWAWLLMRCGGQRANINRATALRLIAFAESWGIRDGTAINAILVDGSPHDAKARLWPQTERLKAALLALDLTGEAKYLGFAVEAATSILGYLDTQVAGLWHDERRADGGFAPAPSPASNFYHLVGAIAAIAEKTSIKD